MGTSIKQRIERAQRNRGEVVNIFKEEPQKLYEITVKHGLRDFEEAKRAVSELKESGFKHRIVIRLSNREESGKITLIG